MFIIILSKVIALDKRVIVLDNLEETVELILFFQIDRGKIASMARKGINSVPQTDATIFSFASVSILLLWILSSGLE